MPANHLCPSFDYNKDASVQSRCNQFSWIGFDFTSRHLARVFNFRITIQISTPWLVGIGIHVFVATLPTKTLVVAQFSIQDLTPSFAVGMNLATSASSKGFGMRWGSCATRAHWKAVWLCHFRFRSAIICFPIFYEDIMHIL